MRSSSAFSAMTYDAGGNRLGETASVPARGSAPDLSRTVTYGYDNLDQLTQEASTGSAAGTTYTETFGYDLAGNPTSTSGRRATTGAAFNADNQATRTGYTGTGDPLGLYLFANTTASSATFDPEDRLASLPSYAFYTSYDGDGLRTVDGYSYTYYLYDGDQSVAEVASNQSGQPTLSAFNGYGASGLEWRSGSGSSYSAYTYDPQGSVVEPVTLYYTGGPPVIKVRSSSLYDGFGLGMTTTAEGSAGLDPYDSVGFGGQHGYYHDYTTGLYLLTHRYYDAGAGRFVTRDPIGYKGGINLYGFAGNNPVNNQDPDGTQTENGPNLLMPPLYDQNPAGPVYDGSAANSQEHPSTAAVLSGRADKSNGGTATLGEGKSPNVFLTETLPGEDGVPISRRPTVQEMQRLTKKRKVEFAVTYLLGPGKNGGGGQYYLHSGTRTRIGLPIGGSRMLICHSHPGSTLEASPLDMGYLTHAAAVCHSKQISSVVIPARGNPFRFGGKYGTGVPTFVCH